MQHNNVQIPNMLILRSSSIAAILPCRKRTLALGMVSDRSILSTAFRTNERFCGAWSLSLCVTSRGWAEVQRIRVSLTPNECDQMHMTGLQREIEGSRIAIYELSWGGVDSAEDLMAYQEAIASGTSR